MLTVPRPPRPDNEIERQATLDAYRILDTPREAAFDDLVAIATAVCDVPIAMVSLIDRDRQWFKASSGIDVTETGRDVSFCAHAILDPGNTMIVPDAQLDARFRDNPMVTGGMKVRFYAGAPLLSVEGLPMGTFCVVDDRPRELTPTQRRALEALSRQASRLMEMHRVTRELHLQLEERGWYEQQLLHYQQELESQNADLAEQSATDPLTGLANRRAFARTLDAAIRDAAGTGSPLAIGVIDIDHFKMINDLHGHAEGDRVLQAVAEMLRAHGGAARGRVARYGGEEFVWLLADTTGGDAVAQCDQLRGDLAFAATGLPVTISVGVAALQPGEDVAALFARADEALYEAKRGGRDRVHLAA
ncbi:sensor domain-containing diguanylate cyclase [Luteimonas sp. BDR2-5]|uniref:sensor domain-containing diguanylate cyclase n=1 Tax=Proluteimonas luteida TaxID=2878685 RepID=UPI001E445785|nr:sensor domain-containing diguanylate cyclase [Luteimonas sp. BDR2-5]MCD9028286.1 sensor domain-containing diguanylate cyclase [Luteimonas sp. BDR2-5]